MRWYRCVRLTLLSHGGLFTTRDITVKTTVGTHFGDRLAKVCKVFEAKQILRLDSKNENILHQIYRCSGFFSLYFLLHSFVYCRCAYLQTVLPWLISYHWPVDLHMYFPPTKQPPWSKKGNCVSPKRVVNIDTGDCSCTPKDVALWEKTSCWQFGHHNPLLNFITSGERGHFLRLFVEKPSILDMEVEEKNVVWPHNIQSRMSENKWWSVHTVLGNVYNSSKIKTQKEGRLNHRTLDRIKTRPAKLVHGIESLWSW